MSNFNTLARWLTLNSYLKNTYQLPAHFKTYPVRESNMLESGLNFYMGETEQNPIHLIPIGVYTVPDIHRYLIII